MGCVISFQDFSELFGKHRALLLPSAASLFFFFFFWGIFACQVWSDPFGEPGLSGGRQTPGSRCVWRGQDSSDPCIPKAAEPWRIRASPHLHMGDEILMFLLHPELWNSRFPARWRGNPNEWDDSTQLNEEHSVSSLCRVGIPTTH